MGDALTEDEPISIATYTCPETGAPLRFSDVDGIGKILNDVSKCKRAYIKESVPAAIDE